MNNAKLWLVVSPTIGVPLFLSAVAVGSFAVHVAVLSNTTWVSDFLSGKPLGAATATAALVAPQTGAAHASFDATGSQTVLVVMPDGTTAQAILQMPQPAGTLN